MKKIIALIMALTLVFALASCAPASTDLIEYTEAIANTTPASAIIDVTTYDTEFAIELKGLYTVTYNEDGTATLEYEYEKLNPAIVSGSDAEMKEVINGSATIGADGAVTGDVSASVIAATVIKFDLTKTIKTYIVARGILTANIDKANTAAVLGVELPSDASLELRLAETEAGARIGQATVNYTTDRGTVRIVCQYN